MSLPIGDLDNTFADIEKEKNNLESIPVAVRNFVCNTMYHVLFDCDFGLFYNKENRKNYTDITFEGLSGKKTNGIPITYDKNDANNIAKDLLKAVNRGSFGIGMDKRYPYLGVVIVGFRFDDCKSVIYAEKDENNVGREHLIYHKKNDSGTEVWTGIISKSALDNIIVTEGEIVSHPSVDKKASYFSFALLNSVPSLSVNNIHVLKCLYYKEGGSCFSSENEVRGLLDRESLEPISHGSVALPGQDGGYYSNYVREKAKYLLKKNSGQLGGNEDKTDTDWKRIYKQKKAEYQNLKKSLQGK